MILNCANFNYAVSADAVPSVPPIVRSAGRGKFLLNLLYCETLPDVGRSQTELSSFSASAPCGSGRSTQTGEPSVAVPYRVSVDAVPSISPIVRSAGRRTILPNILNREALPVVGRSQTSSTPSESGRSLGRSTVPAELRVRRVSDVPLPTSSASPTMKITFSTHPPKI